MMSRYFEADRNTLLSLGLLSANVHSVLTQVARDKSANHEQRRIVKNAITLTQNIRDGKFAKPTQNQFLALPSPNAAKARTFAIKAWGTIVPKLKNGRRASANFDEIMDEYLKLFERLESQGKWGDEQQETASQAMSFFRTLSQVVVDNLNGLVEEEGPATGAYQTA